jgi:hypothetical protein
MSTTLVYILCPPGIVAFISMTNPDAESVWLFYGPLNALLYGAIGYVFWLFFMGMRTRCPKRTVQTDLSTYDSCRVGIGR